MYEGFIFILLRRKKDPTLLNFGVFSMGPTVIQGHTFILFVNFFDPYVPFDKKLIS